MIIKNFGCIHFCFFQVLLFALFSVAFAAPKSGPLTPLVGNLVQTPRGFKRIDLEGFSEDVNKDGFVDPIVPVAPVAFEAAPVAPYAYADAPIAYPAAPYVLNAGPAYPGY